MLAAQRSETISLPLKWEFPGGKIDAGESPVAALKREIIEELGVSIKIKESLRPLDWQYPSFAITLHPFVCSIRAGEIVLAEHKAIRWLLPNDLPGLDWADADFPVLRDYFKTLRNDKTDCQLGRPCHRP